MLPDALEWDYYRVMRLVEVFGHYLFCGSVGFDFKAHMYKVTDCSHSVLSHVV